MLNCLNPVFASRVGLTEKGRALLSFRGSSAPHYVLPCGKCAACVANKRKAWCDRMELELFSRDYIGTFLTLTYAPEHCPDRLDKPALQRFLKRLRNAPRDYGVLPFDFTYFAVGEYGKKHNRPHYHLALFGVDMTTEDWLPRVVGFDGSHATFASGIIEKIWPYGFNVVGSLNSASIKYVSKYVSKNLADKDSELPTFYIRSLGVGNSPFMTARRNGRKWLYDYKPDFLHGFETGYFCTFSGSTVRKIPFPAFLKPRVRELYPDLFDDVQATRMARMKNLSVENKRPANVGFLRSQTLAETIKRKLDNEC